MIDVWGRAEACLPRKKNENIVFSEINKKTVLRQLEFKTCTLLATGFGFTTFVKPVLTHYNDNELVQA